MKRNKEIDKLLILIVLTVIALLVGLICFVISLHVPMSSQQQKQDFPKQTTSVKQPYYKVTAEERELIARIVTCEADEYSVECQRAVASVIFNRLESGRWQKDMNNDDTITVYDIIYYPNAFTPVLDGALDKCTDPSDSAVKAVDYVIQHGPTVPEYVRYFRDYKHFTWQGYKGYTVIDDMYFGYFEDWENGAW